MGDCGFCILAKKFDGLAMANFYRTTGSLLVANSRLVIFSFKWHGYFSYK